MYYYCIKVTISAECFWSNIMTKKSRFGVHFHHIYLLMVWILILLVIGYFIFVNMGIPGIQEKVWLILILVIMAGTITFLFCYFNRRKNVQSNFSTYEYSFEGLKEQLARGDITPEQYDRMNKELMKRTLDYILTRP